jgi:hypothetical protein
LSLVNQPEKFLIVPKEAEAEVSRLEDSLRILGVVVVSETRVPFAAGA